MNSDPLSNFFRAQLEEHATVASNTLAQCERSFIRLVEAAVAVIQNQGKLMFFGNGGSAADAQHLATELAVRYISDRKPIPAIALTTDTSALTAIGNDLGFDLVFERQIEALGRKGDLAIGISTSGRSQNVIRGLQMARKMQIGTVALSGGDGGFLVGLADPLVLVPSITTARIQEMHITLGQMLCGALEQQLGLV